MIKYTFPVLAKLGFADENIYTTLENRMKCGFGKCGRCNVGNVYVCKDGPVFTLAQLKELPDEYGLEYDQKLIKAIQDKYGPWLLTGKTSPPNDIAQHFIGHFLRVHYDDYYDSSEMKVETGEVQSQGCPCVPGMEGCAVSYMMNGQLHWFESNFNGAYRKGKPRSNPPGLTSEWLLPESILGQVTSQRRKDKWNGVKTSKRFFYCKAIFYGNAEDSRYWKLRRSLRPTVKGFLTGKATRCILSPNRTVKKGGIELIDGLLLSEELRLPFRLHWKVWEVGKKPFEKKDRTPIKKPIGSEWYSD